MSKSMDGWFIITPKGERFPYSLENVSKVLANADGITIKKEGK